MKLNFWQILGGVLIVVALLYAVVNRARTTPTPAVPSPVPEVTSQPA